MVQLWEHDLLLHPHPHPGGWHELVSTPTGGRCQPHTLLLWENAQVLPSTGPMTLLAGTATKLSRQCLQGASTSFCPLFQQTKSVVRTFASNSGRVDLDWVPGP